MAKPADETIWVERARAKRQVSTRRLLIGPTSPGNSVIGVERSASLKRGDRRLRWPKGGRPGPRAFAMILWKNAGPARGYVQAATPREKFLGDVRRRDSVEPSSTTDQLGIGTQVSSECSPGG